MMNMEALHPRQSVQSFASMKQKLNNPERANVQFLPSAIDANRVRSFSAPHQIPKSVSLAR